MRAAISSDPSHEMLHSRLQRVCDLRFGMRSENPICPKLIFDCMVTYNYNLEWYRAIRSNPENLLNKIQKIDINEELIEDDKERVKLHNWLTDSDNSDQSVSDC